MAESWEGSRKMAGVDSRFVDRLFAELKGMRPHPANGAARVAALENFGSTVRCLVVEPVVEASGVTIHIRQEELENERDWLGQMGMGVVAVGVMALGAALGAGDLKDVVTDPERIAEGVWKAAEAAASPS